MIGDVISQDVQMLSTVEQDHEYWCTIKNSGASSFLNVSQPHDIIIRICLYYFFHCIYSAFFQYLKKNNCRVNGPSNKVYRNGYFFIMNKMAMTIEKPLKCHLCDNYLHFNNSMWIN